MPGQVVDPALLAQLNGPQAGSPVVDPSILAQLNSGQELLREHRANIENIPQTSGGMYRTMGPGGEEIDSKNIPAASASPYVTPNAATGSTDTQNYLAGFSKFPQDAKMAFLQMTAPALDAIGHTAGTPNSWADIVQRHIDEGKATDAPLMDTKAGVAGNITANVVAGAPFAPEGALAAGTVGALQGAFQPVATGDHSRLSNMLIGGGLGVGGNLASKILPRIAQPVANVLSPEDQKAVRILSDAGIPLTTAERSGSPVLNQLASALGDNPLTAGQVAGIKAEQGTAFNRAVLQKIGEDAPAATKEVMGRAADRIGGVFNDVAARNPVHLDTNLASDMQRVLETARGEMTDQQFAVVQQHVTNIINAASRGDGQIAGEAFQKLYSGLGKVTKSAEYGSAARDLRESLQDALVRSAQDPADVAALQTARQQYQAMKQMEGAIANDGSGNISVLKLSNALGTKANRSQSVYGRGNQDLVELAQAGRSILPDWLANSGTPARLEAGAAPGIAGRTLVELGAGKPVEAAKTAAFGIAPKISAPIALDTGKLGLYLSNGVTNKLARMLLQAPGTAPGRGALQYGTQPLLLNSLESANGSGQ